MRASVLRSIFTASLAGALASMGACGGSSDGTTSASGAGGEGGAPASSSSRGSSASTLHASSSIASAGGAGGEAGASSSASGGGESSGGAGGQSSSAGGAGGQSSSAGGAGESSAGGAGGESSAGGAGGGSSGPPVYCGHPADCAGGTHCGVDGLCHAGACGTSDACIYGFSCDAGTCLGAANGCDKSAECASGSVCIAGSDDQGGRCTPPSGQCVDGAQCGSFQACADGVCTPTCVSDAGCRDGLRCDTSVGLCRTPSTTCTITNDCGSAVEVCVAGVCVPRSAGPNCPTLGDVWTENGCVPNQGPTFTCQQDGMQDACASGSICLYHSCWISCDAPNQLACAAQIVANACKPLTEGATFHVCSSAQDLGNQCGPGTGTGATCSGNKTCVNGFCK